MRNLLEPTYDAHVDAMYISLTDDRTSGIAVRQVIVDAAPCEGEVILDFDKNGRLLGVEILGAADSVAPELIALARRIG